MIVWPTELLLWAWVSIIDLQFIETISAIQACIAKLSPTAPYWEMYVTMARLIEDYLARFRRNDVDPDQDTLGNFNQEDRAQVYQAICDFRNHRKAY